MNISKNLFLRTIAFFTALTVSVTGTAPAGVSTPQTTHESIRPFPAIDQFTIPGHLGTIQEKSFIPDAESLVILIQDAHAVPDAQKSIQKLIEYIQTEYGITQVALEAVDGVLDPRMFKSFPDQELLARTFEDYAKRGEWTGPSAAAVFGKSAGEYTGVEDWALYEQGLELYQTADKNSQEILGKINSQIEINQQSKQKHYSPELLRLDSAVQNFQKNHEGFADLLKLLHAVMELPADTELAALLGEMERESEMNPQITEEIHRYAEGIREALGKGHKNRSSEFHEKHQSYQTGHISASEFALYLDELAGEISGISETVPFSFELQKMAANQRMIRGIDGTRLFTELEAYVGKVKERFFRNEEERRIEREGETLVLLQKLAKLEISRDEWEKINTQYGQDEAGNPDAIADLSFHIAFYRNAAMREAAMFENLKKILAGLQASRSERPASSASEPKAAAIFVAGGFHTEGLLETFKRYGMASVLIRPRIGDIPEQGIYQAQMRGDISWKNYFRDENGSVNLYDAFVRAVRDKLINAVTSGTEHVTRQSSLLLKTWRDQIIRDLARDGRTADARQYTRFLDETAFEDLSAAQAIHPFARIEKFMNGLKNLEDRGALNRQNILKLLQPATMGAAAPAGALGIRSRLSSRLAGIRSEVRNELEVSGSQRPIESSKKTAVYPWFSSEERRAFAQQRRDVSIRIDPAIEEDSNDPDRVLVEGPFSSVRATSTEILRKYPYYRIASITPLSRTHTQFVLESSIDHSLDRRGPHSAKKIPYGELRSEVRADNSETIPTSVP